MGRLWDALKKAEREGSENIVTSYEESFEAPPEEYIGDLQLNLPPHLVEEYLKLASSLSRFETKSGTKLKTLLVTAPRQGEGTTTVALSLAASLASNRKSQNILLIDANLRHPDIHHYLDLAQGPGLADIPANFEHRHEFVKPSPIRRVTNFKVITAGEMYEPLTPTEVCTSDQVHSFIEELKGYFDLIIIDSPPVNPYSDAVQLSALADGAILVVSAQGTRWEVADRAREVLTTANTNLLGVVLNKRKMHIPKSVYKRL